jgi:hypothetical protein
MNFIRGFFSFALLSLFICFYAFCELETDVVTKNNARATGNFTSLKVTGPSTLNGTLTASPQAGKKMFYVNSTGVNLGYGTGVVSVGNPATFNRTYVILE